VNEFQPLIDQLYREEVEQARALGPEGRLRTWVELLEMNLAMGEAMGREEIARRFRIVRKVDEHRCYGPPQARR